MHRRAFVKNSLTIVAMANVPFITDAKIDHLKMIKVIETRSDFEREKLIRPFGFKGAYLTELWQTAVSLRSVNYQRTGLATQSVLYGDAELFGSFSESGGNALMYALTEKALALIKVTPFQNPVELMEKIEPVLMEEAIRITGKKDVNKNFLLNALVAPDNAAWLLFAAENNFKDFLSMIPPPYQQALSFRNKKVGVLFQVSYGMPLSEIKEAVEQGYFLIKIKTGQPGTQAEMLAKDMQRLSEVHDLLKDFRTTHTVNGKLYYTMDANTRYERRETLLRYLDHARKIGAMEQILFIEEPLHENNEEDVSDVGVPIGADESVHNVESAIRRMQLGYRVMVLKGIAKTLSESIKIAKLAHDRGIPCICADLTVNPILIDWNKNLAARIAPYPGLDMGIMETNGDRNYKHWQTMLSYHPAAGAGWTTVKKGVFELDSDYYSRSGGILESSFHYQELPLKE